MVTPPPVPPPKSSFWLEIAAAAAEAEGDPAHRQDNGAIGGDDLPSDDGIGINEGLQVFHIAFGQLTQIMCHSSNLRKVY